jgi:hypothetical protein
MEFNPLNPISLTTFGELCKERMKQHSKFGEQPRADRFQLLSIAGEEYGEVCRAVNQGLHPDTLREEIIQLAAVCIAYLDEDLHFGTQK